MAAVAAFAAGAVAVEEIVVVRCLVAATLAVAVADYSPAAVYSAATAMVVDCWRAATLAPVEAEAVG